MTYRSSGDELEARRASGPPLFKPVWSGDIVGIVLGVDTDWVEITELVTDSYCLLAPKRLAALVWPGH